MKQELSIKEFVVFNADVKKMTDAELEKTLMELRAMRNDNNDPRAMPQRRAA